ncbi:ribosome assembly factor SBDS [Picrophilus oshimae]|uniref:Ribosome maturation protein SDO1 n=1 Tax=Picrophilus torridus (strain ATCC 700027 / DSM 9790 / JCM 10055 / NBRC 100828 / KAW 2/3) TaxID=1122961 RepID=Q6L1E1_PICTO|nr:ribosome assembly factor SBDS [Picrophilus oshimae]AAT43211.1 hypothetical protein PTO0626 [Picrophilus oshimae DSM 9789]SMD30484.1 ribosome maturation protein SDO1 [Picrophilus oshimae DSM 9789]
MVNTDDAIIARYESHGHRFEILIDPASVDKIRSGNIDVEKDMALDEIFKDARKGERAGEESLKEVFKTTDVSQIAIEIVRKGEVQLTTDQRRKMTEEKKRQIINEIVRQAINPQTNTPIPAIRIEEAMEEAKFHVDPFKSTEEQVQAVLKAIRPLIPIRFEKTRLAIKMSGEDYGKAYGDIAKVGSIIKEEWSNSGDYMCIIEIPAGMQGEVIDMINKRSRGNAEVKILK